MHQSNQVLFPLMASATLQHSVYHFHGDLDCKLDKEWCWRVEVLKFFGSDSDDHLGSDKACTALRRADYRIEGNVDGSTSDSEFGLILTHSCIPTGAQKKIHLPSLWKALPAQSDPYEFKKDFDLP